MASNERYNPAWKPRPTFGLDGVLYRSGLEARCANAMKRLGMPYAYEPASFPLPNIVGGYYTPDYIIDDPYVEGGRQVAEAKGWLSNKARAAAKSFKSKADDPNDVHKVTSYVQIWTDHIDLHRDGKDYVAAVYKCDDCDGPGYFAPVTADHSCPHCGSQHVTYITRDMNEWDNEQYKKEWTKNWERAQAVIQKNWKEFKEASEINSRNAEQLRRIAKHYSAWELEPADGVIRFMSPVEEHGYYVPEFTYTEPFKNRKTKGTAFDPIAIVSCENRPTTERQNTFDMLREYVKDPTNPLVKHAVYNDRGWFVADAFTGGEYKHGHLYECQNPECGKVYPAGEGYEVCPCCGNKHNPIIDGKE